MNFLWLSHGGLVTVSWLFLPGPLPERQAMVMWPSCLNVTDWLIFNWTDKNRHVCKAGNWSRVDCLMTVSWLSPDCVMTVSWLLKIDCWSLIPGNWLLEINCWKLIVGNWLLEIDCWKLIAWNWLLEIDC